MKLRSIRLRLTLGVLLILGPFLFALSHLLMAVVHRHDPSHVSPVPGPLVEPPTEGIRLLYILSGIAVLASGVGAWLVVGRTLSPIRDLTDQARSVSPEEGLSPLVASSTDVEMIELVDTLNGLLRRVAEAGEAKTRFHVAISHELRTPLQALSGHLELAASRPRTPEEYRAIVGEAQAQTRRIGTLVEGVLLLHRIESERNLDVESIRVDEVVERLTEGERVVWCGRDPLEVHGVAPHLDILVSNLVSNALRHGSGTDPVTVSVTSAAGGTLRIANAVGEPDHGSPRSGNGLGIPISHAICRTNGWRMSQQRDGGRFSVQIRFGAAD